MCETYDDGYRCGREDGYVEGWENGYRYARQPGLIKRICIATWHTLRSALAFFQIARDEERAFRQKGY